MKKAQKIEMKTVVSSGLRVWNSVTATLLFVGLFFTFFSALDFSLAYCLAFLPGCGCIVAYNLLDKRGKKFLFLAAGVLSVVLLTASVTTLLGSAAKLVNGIVEKCNQNMHWGFSSVKTMPSGGFSDFVLAAVIFLWISLFVAAKFHGLLALLFGTSGYVLILVCLGLFPNPFAVMLLIAATLSRCVAVNNVNWKKTCAFLAVVLFVTVAVGGSFAYSGSKAVQKARQGFSDAADRLAYGEDSLPQGQLQRAQGLLSNDVRLYVTLPQQTTTLYLRGFVGSNLLGSQWQPTDKNAYVTADSQGLIRYLANQNFPFGQYAQYLALSGNTDSFTVDVENVGANSKYFYAPYAVYQTGGIANYDMNLLRGVVGAKSYSFNIAAQDGKSERIVQNSWLFDSGNRTDQMKEYLKLDGYYRSFVYDTYLDLNGADCDVIFEKLGGLDANSIFSVSRLIRLWFNDEFTVSEQPDALSDDFFSDFFGGRVKKANAAYFASAATLAFRAYGIPARYVEGYYVRAGELSERTTLQVTGKNSHAWTEVYFDGIGWLPIEVTYFTEDDIKDDPNVSGSPTDGQEEPNVKPKPTDPSPSEEHPVPPEIIPPAGTPEHALYVFMMAGIPVLAVVLALSLAVLLLVLHRMWVVSRKRKKLNTNGEAFGCAAMAVLDHDCRSIGGYTQAKARQLGLGAEDTQRFVELVERAVYGSYDLSLAERLYVEKYIVRVGEALSNSRGKTHRLLCKYIYCIGL